MLASGASAVSTVTPARISVAVMIARRCWRSLMTSPRYSSGTLTSTRITGSRSTDPAAARSLSTASAAAIRIATSPGGSSGIGLSMTAIRTPHSGQPFSPPRSALSRTASVIAAAMSARDSFSGNHPCSTVTPN